MPLPRSCSRGVLTALAAAALAAGIAPAAHAAGSASDLLDVVQVGTGSAPLTNAATASFVVPMLGTGGTGTPIVLPTATSGAQRAIGLSGSAGSEGTLALSADGNYLTLVGYGATPGTTGPGGGSINGNTAAVTPRVVARINGAGQVDTSTALTDAFSASNVRGVVSSDGTHFWVTGDGSKATGSFKNAPIAYVSALGATTSTALTTSPTQARVPAIAGGSLYFSTKTGTAAIYRVGAAGTVPVATGQTAAPIATEGDPYGFAFVKLDSTSTGPDTLYVADGTTGGIFKFSLVGGSWVAKGSAAGATLASLTAKVSGSAVTLYATTADGLSVVAFSDTSAAGATMAAGSYTTIGSAPANTAYRGIALAPAGQTPPPPPTPTPTVSLSDNALGAAIGDAHNPTIDAAVSDDPLAPSDLTVTATSSNQAVVPDGAITVTGSGATRTVSLVPAGVGTATITVTAATPDGTKGTSTFKYGASAAATDATTRYLYGASNASTAIDVGGGYLLIADDESATLRLYRGDRSGQPVKTWSFTTELGNPGELDLEWAARSGDTIVWGGSQSNDKSGNQRASTSTVFATQITGSGLSTNLTFAGFTTTLRSDILAWDHGNGDPLGLAAAGAAGVDPKTAAGYNIEGMEFGLDGTTAYLGFRAPTIPPNARHLALVVPVTNLLSMLSGTASHATFAGALQWDLGGLAIREIRKNASNQFLVIAGTPGSGTPQQLYTWDGNPAHAPVQTGTVLPAPPAIDGNWESIASFPSPLSDGDTVSVVQDNGDTVWYGGSTIAKDLAAGLQKDWLDDVTLALPGQSVAFDSSAPSPAYTGGTYTPAAHGGASGKPVVLSIDPSSGAGVCSITGAVVSFDAPGTCVLAADQDGTFQYGAAATRTQSITVQAPPDVTAPSASIVQPVDGATYGQGQIASASYSCSDEPGGSGIASCTGDVASGDPIDTNAVGQHTFTVTATDGAGNTGTAAASYTVREVTPPTIALTTPTDGADYDQNAVVAADYSCSDAGSGIATCSGTVDSGDAIDTSSLGDHTFQVTAVDKAGNSATTTAHYSVSDVTAPAITIAAPTATTYGRGTTVIADFDCADEAGGSGLSTCTGTVADGEGIDTAALGARTFVVTARDAAGNASSKTVEYTVVDTKAPAITLTTPTDGAVYDRGTVVKAQYTCADETGGSGIATCDGPVASGAAIDTASLGQKTFRVDAADAAGNAVSKSVRYTVRDATAPLITLTAPKAIAYGRGATVRADYACVDDAGGSGIVSCTGTVAKGAAIDTGSAGTKSFTVTALDAAGNQSTQTVKYTVTDQTPPTITSTTPAEGATYKQSQAINASYKCADETGGSGLSTCAGYVASGRPIDTRAPGPHTFRITASDAAGNKATLDVHYTVVDATAPNITITRPSGSYTYGSSVTASYLCYDNDSGSGIASCTGTVANGAAINTKVTRGVATKFTVTAIDKAGNKTTKTVTYTTK